MAGYSGRFKQQTHTRFSAVSDLAGAWFDFAANADQNTFLMAANQLRKETEKMARKARRLAPYVSGELRSGIYTHYKLGVTRAGTYRVNPGARINPTRTGRWVTMKAARRLSGYIEIAQPNPDAQKKALTLEFGRKVKGDLQWDRRTTRRRRSEWRRTTTVHQIKGRVGQRPFFLLATRDTRGAARRIRNALRRGFKQAAMEARLKRV